MCAIYFTNQKISKEEVNTKLKSIEFRGPDHTGVLQKDDLTFGHLRLSILDLDIRSNQPMEFESYTIVFNGEIYNFQDIRSELLVLGYTFDTTGDTEVLLKGFKEWGSQIVPKLNGMFAFAIYDLNTRKIFCSRDRLGVKPFYYSWKDGNFEACSQIKPLSHNKKINEEAVSMFLDCTYIPSPHTIFEDVYKLSPGNNMTIDLNSNQITIEEYWNLKDATDSGLNYEEAKLKLHNLLKDAVKIRLQSDVPFGSFLSGGIDSALITSIASKISTDPIRTFSIGFEDPEFDESKIAAQYAGILSTVHTETICTPEDILEMLPKLIQVYDEPFADSSALPSLLLNKVTKQYVTMALSGDGGDESFLGYNHFDWIYKVSKLMKIPFYCRKILAFFVTKPILKHRASSFKKILKSENIDSVIEDVFIGFNSILKVRDRSWLSNFGIFKKLSANSLQKDADLNIKLWLENDSNVKVDRASMAFSVEVRSPFLDYRIIEFARTLPVSYRYLPGNKKRILRDILKEYIPEEVFNQPKKGFAVPIGAWIRNELREEFELSLTDSFLQQVPNLDIPKFKKMFTYHLQGKYDYSSYIWRVYVLSKWYREYGFFKDNDEK
jgi:asparagine synthase (glutamine-hydrolysing)